MGCGVDGDGGQDGSIHLQDVNDQYRLWALRPDTIRFSRELDLVSVVGTRENMDEYHALLRVIESTVFEDVT